MQSVAISRPISNAEKYRNWQTSNKVRAVNYETRQRNSVLPQSSQHRYTSQAVHVEGRVSVKHS